MELLCAAGADANIKVNGSTPLHVAAQLGHTACVEALLRHHADIDAHDSTGYVLLLFELRVLTMVVCRRTPLVLAVENHRGAVVKLLLERGASASLQLQDGSTLLHVSARKVCYLFELCDQCVYFVTGRCGYVAAVACGRSGCERPRRSTDDTTACCSSC